MQMDDAEQSDIVSPSQGIHLVIDSSFFPGTNAMMIPKTDDGRVLFAVPWHSKVVVGTTDTPIETTSIEPKPLEEEIEFLLEHINRYTTSTVSRSDVKSVYVGLRPLVKVKGSKTTSLLSRDHTLVVATSGLVTITGGKWTTYRKMAEDAVSNAVFIGKLEKKDCITRFLPIGNVAKRNEVLDQWKTNDVTLSTLLHPEFPYTMADVLFSIRFEMAQTVEDILARRTRLLFLDSKAAISSAQTVAVLLAEELGKNEQWMKEQVSTFDQLAEQYLLS
jgi:glycerol-3-phosphate dehydrogenase